MSLSLSLYPRRIFVDASAYYAIADAGDNFHDNALTILGTLESDNWRLFTTNFVIAETHALLVSRAGHRYARKALKSIIEGRTTIVRVRMADEVRSWEIIDRYDDKDFSFTDGTSFAIMERLHIHHAFANDRHFEQYGFTVLSS